MECANARRRVKTKELRAGRTCISELRSADSQGPPGIRHGGAEAPRGARRCYTPSWSFSPIARTHYLMRVNSKEVRKGVRQQGLRGRHVAAEAPTKMRFLAEDSATARFDPRKHPAQMRAPRQPPKNGSTRRMSPFAQNNRQVLQGGQRQGGLQIGNGFSRKGTAKPVRGDQ